MSKSKKTLFAVAVVTTLTLGSLVPLVLAETPAEKIAKLFGIDPAVVVSLYEQGYSYGNIKTTYAFASVAMGLSGNDLNKEAAELLEMKASGMGWGKIAKELGYPPSAIGQSIAEIRSKERSLQRGEFSKTGHSEEKGGPKGRRGR